MPARWSKREPRCLDCVLGDVLIDARELEEILEERDALRLKVVSLEDEVADLEASLWEAEADC